MGALLRGRGAARVGIAALGVLVLAVPIGVAAASGATRAAEATFLETSRPRWTCSAGRRSGPSGRCRTTRDRATWPARQPRPRSPLGTLVGIFLLWRLALGGEPASARRTRPSGQSAAVVSELSGGCRPRRPGRSLARSLIYWFRDARQARQLILLPVLPALMLLWWSLFDIEAIALAIGPIVATILPLSAFAGLSYDGTAFAAEISAGIRGVHDRLGRALALVIIAVPATVIVQVAVALIIGRGADLPALLGLSLGTLLISVGVVSVSSARFVVPVARSGRNPFSAQAGAATTSIFASYSVAIATLAAGRSDPRADRRRDRHRRCPSLGWLALIAGIGVGAAVAFGGVVVGGRVLDASGPAMLARLRLVRT